MSFWQVSSVDKSSYVILEEGNMKEDKGEESTDDVFK